MSQQPVGMPVRRRVRGDSPPRLFARRRESRLLLLPSKIRQMIYHHALAPQMTTYGMEDKYTLEQPPLAYVSRKEREERLPIFYAINHFMITVQSGLCPGGFPEKTIARVLDYFAFYYGLIPRQSSLRSVRSIQLFWHDMPFLTCFDHSLDLIVAFGRHKLAGPMRTTRLQVARWEPREAEQAVRSAILRSLREWSVSAGCDLRFDIRSLRPLMNIVWLCGINCTYAAREVYLSTRVKTIPPPRTPIRWVSSEQLENMHRRYQEQVLRNGGELAS